MTGFPLWISEAEVADLLNLSDAIEALEGGLRRQAAGAARNMSKTHLTWGEGDTLHAIGAVFDDAGVVGAKTWAHTPGGATPLLVLWDAHTGALMAVIEAFALGQMRTGAMSGVATRWMSDPDAEVFALFGTGKQALAQLAAVAAVRPLKTVRIWGRDAGRRAQLVTAASRLGYGFTIETPAAVAEAADGAGVVTLATRARDPFFTAAMAAPGAHINAIGAITPEREEFTSDVLNRATLIAADDPAAARRLSKEFGDYFAGDEAGWTRIRPIAELVGAGGRSAVSDLSVFKAMGMGVSDLALGLEVHMRAVDAGCGRPLDPPRKVAPRLQAPLHEELC
jgi:ornithine cyclodeaminase